MTFTVIATGISGQKYEYILQDHNQKWPDLPLNYLFAYETPANWPILYIGQAGSAASRMTNHEVWRRALMINSATRIFAHVSSENELIRCAEERDLIAKNNPPLNIQHRTAPAGQSALRRLPTNHTHLGGKR